jgi:hypothetical protein
LFTPRLPNSAIIVGIWMSKTNVPLPLAPNVRATMILEAMLSINPPAPLRNFRETFFRYDLELF